MERTPRFTVAKAAGLLGHAKPSDREPRRSYRKKRQRGSVQKIEILSIDRTLVIEVDVRFGAHFGLNSDIARCLRRANIRHSSAYSITSSASTRRVCGTVMPNAFAVDSMISSNLVGPDLQENRSGRKLY
jgi:hypothetical protein